MSTTSRSSPVDDVREPLARVSTVEALVVALRRRILNGEIRPGERLRETELAARYEVGRYTVRAAFQELEHLGMTDHKPHRGVSVSQPSMDEVADLYAYRAALECEAARLIVERHLDLTVVDQALERLEATPADSDWAQVLEADLAMHRAIVTASGSRRMQDAFGGIVDQVMLFLSTLGLAGYPTSDIAADHRKIARALKSGDADRAAAVVRAHLNEMVDLMHAKTG